MLADGGRVEAVPVGSSCAHVNIQRCWRIRHGMNARSKRQSARHQSMGRLCGSVTACGPRAGRFARNKQ